MLYIRKKYSNYWKDHTKLCTLEYAVYYTFDKFEVELHQYAFDIITLSETWLQNDSNLP